MSERRGSGAVPDAAAVLADDRLLDRLGARSDASTGAAGEGLVGEPVVALLVAWRDELDAAPVREWPSVDEAARVLGARRVGSRLRRGFLVVSAAASVVGVALVGLGIGAHHSVPGDPLWGVSQTLFVDHSRSVQAAEKVDTELDTARRLLDSGSPVQAQLVLAQARVELASVAPEQDLEGLLRTHDELAGQAAAAVTAAADGPAVPPVPPVTDTVAAAPPLVTTPAVPSATVTTAPSPVPTRTPPTLPVTTVAPTTAPPTTVAPTTVPTTTAPDGTSELPTTAPPTTTSTTPVETTTTSLPDTPPS